LSLIADNAEKQRKTAAAVRRRVRQSMAFDGWFSIGCDKLASPLKFLSKSLIFPNRRCLFYD